MSSPPRSCRFDDGLPALGRFAMDQGCMCFPHDREQDLCSQHAHQSEPLGSMELITSYVEGWP